MRRPHEVLPELLQQLRASTGLETLTGYYPGADTDRGPLDMVARLQGPRRMIYADYWTRREVAKSLLRRQSGRRVISEHPIQPGDLGLQRWEECWHGACGAHTLEKARSAFGIQVRTVARTRRGGGPGVARGEDGRWMRSGGPSRGNAIEPTPADATMDAIFLGAEGIGSYRILVSLGWAPNLLVLQDHGLGGNWNAFGAGSLLEDSAHALGALPELLLVAENTKPWRGYTRVSAAFPYPGQLHAHARALFLRDDLEGVGTRESRRGVFARGRS